MLLGMRSTLLSSFSPAALFAAGEQGVWYDPSDMATLFQDSSGTTPVTAVEQPVGLMLDKSKRLVIGPELVTNGDFANGTTGWTAAGGSIAVVSGEMQVTRVSVASTAYQAITTVVGQIYKVTGKQRVITPSAQPNIVARTGTDPTMGLISAGAATTSGTFVTNTFYFIASGTTTYLHLTAGTASGVVAFDDVTAQSIAGNHATQATPSARPVLSARVNLLTATTTLSTQSVTTVAVNYTLRFVGAGSITLSGTATGSYNAGTHTITCTAGTLTLTVSGTVTDADLRVANDTALPVYQRVDTSTSYDTTGFPMYLRFDGSDDAMATASIDFTGGDAMSVFAGVRKASDAGQGVVAELSATIASNNGTFLLAAPDGATQTFGWDSKGTNQVDAVATSLAAPRTAVLTGISDISSDICTIRVNGVQADTDASDQGTGNYGNYALNIGARNNGASVRLNGRIYSLIVRAATTSAADITSTETWVNDRTKAY
jgi:hypothetical protein